MPAPSIDEASRAVHELAVGADAPTLATLFAMLRVRPRARGGKVRAFSKREASEYAPELFAHACELMRRAGAADALFLPFRESFARVCAAPFTILAQSGPSAHQAVVLCAYALGNKLLRQLCFSADWPQDVQKTPWREEFGGLVVPRIAERLNAATAWFAERPEYQREIDLSQIAAALAGERIRAKAAQATDGVSVAPEPTARDDIGADADWESVQGCLLAKRERREPYTSLRMLANEFACSDATIRKAIDRSETLRGWRARSAEPKAACKATDLGAVVRDNTRQTTEPAPENVLPDDDVDATMARLIDQAKPDERAKLNALDDAGRRALVATYQSQNLDDEPSPLKPDKPGERPRKVKQHKRA